MSLAIILFGDPWFWVYNQESFKHRFANADYYIYSCSRIIDILLSTNTDIEHQIFFQFITKCNKGIKKLPKLDIHAYCSIYKILLKI